MVVQIWKRPFFWQKIIGVPLWFLSKKGSLWNVLTPFLVILTFFWVPFFHFSAYIPSKRAQKGQIFTLLASFTYYDLYGKPLFLSSLNSPFTLTFMSLYYYWNRGSIWKLQKWSQNCRPPYTPLCNQFFWQLSIIINYNYYN